MTKSRSRSNGEGSIFAYRNGFAAYVLVTTPAGTRRRKYVYGKTREVVHEKWIKLQTQSRLGPVATKVPTVADYLKYWLDEVVQPNLAPMTYATYESHVRVHIVPALGHRRLDKLTTADVQRWLNSIRRTCQCCSSGRDARRRSPRCCAINKCCQDLPSDKSVGGIRAVLRSAISQAVAEELLTRNVVMAVRLPSRPKRRRQAWTSDEARLFLESAVAGGDSLYVAYVLILTLGLRKGEVLGLCWEDVDLEAGTIDIHSQLQRANGRLYHRETKTEESDAGLPLPPFCIDVLRGQRIAQDRARAAAAEAWQPGTWIVTTRYGTPVEPRNFNRAFEARIQAAGVRRITVHDARRTCATLLVDLDVHPRVIMQILRHAQFALTMEIYAKAPSKATREALRQLGSQLSPADTNEKSARSLGPPLTDSSPAKATRDTVR